MRKISDEALRRVSAARAMVFALLNNTLNSYTCTQLLEEVNAGQTNASMLLKKNSLQNFLKFPSPL